MVNLTRASDELFRRQPDECFGSIAELVTHCEQQRENSQDRWHLPQEMTTTRDLRLQIADDEYAFNDWSFT